MQNLPELPREILESATHPKETLRKMAQETKNTLIGSASMTHEIGEVGKAYADFYGNAIGTIPKTALRLVEPNVVEGGEKALAAAPKALYNLVRMHPIEATKDLAEGLKGLFSMVKLHPIDAARQLSEGIHNTMGDAIKIATSPARLATAGVVGGAKTLGAIAKVPFQTLGFVAKSPLHVWNMLEAGNSKLNEALGRLEAWNKNGGSSHASSA
jgi:hypothetical protein